MYPFERKDTSFVLKNNFAGKADWECLLCHTAPGERRKQWENFNMCLGRFRPGDLEDHWESVHCQKKPVIIPVFTVSWEELIG